MKAWNDTLLIILAAVLREFSGERFEDWSSAGVDSDRCSGRRADLDFSRVS